MMRSDVKVMLGALIVPILTIIAVVVLVPIYFKHLQDRSSAPGRSRDLASALEARGLYAPALDELDRCRIESDLSRNSEADLLFKMGKMADEKLRDCDRAAAYYTMATALNPDASWSNDANKGAVACMEKIGNKKQAQALLAQLTGNGSEPQVAAGDTSPVVAVVDGRSVTWDEVMNHLGPRLDNDKPMDAKMKNQFVQHYLLTLMLSEEAVKKHYDASPSLKPALDQAEREVMAAEYLRRESLDPRSEDAIKKLWEELAKTHETRLFPLSDEQTSK
jgi:tetratricopeptide (TPR) repeat protein